MTTWSIPILDPATSLVEVAYLMATLGCRCEFPDGVPTLIPKNPQSPKPTAFEVMALTSRDDTADSVEGGRRYALVAAFDKFGLCLDVRPIGQC